MKIDEEKFWLEVSSEWKKEIDKAIQEEKESILQEGEITIRQFSDLSGMSYDKSRGRLDAMVRNNKALVRRAKIDGHRMKIYRLLQ